MYSVRIHLKSGKMYSRQLFETQFRELKENYKELLERDLDGVVISSPHGLHYEHSKQALNKNINVYYSFIWWNNPHNFGGYSLWCSLLYD